jgi:hypothetical protein
LWSIKGNYKDVANQFAYGVSFHFIYFEFLFTQLLTPTNEPRPTHLQQSERFHFRQFQKQTKNDFSNIFILFFYFSS